MPKSVGCWRAKISSSFSTLPLGSSRCIVYVEPTSLACPPVFQTAWTAEFQRRKLSGSETKAKTSPIGRAMRTLVLTAVTRPPFRSEWCRTSSCNLFRGSGGRRPTGLSGREAAQDQLDDAPGEIRIDGTAGDEQPVEEGSAEHVEGELEVQIVAEVTALDAALEHDAQRGAATRQEPLTDRARKLHIAAHRVDEAGHRGGFDGPAVDLHGAAHEPEQIALRRAGV